jgi:hypothetical protein
MPNRYRCFKTTLPNWHEKRKENEMLAQYDRAMKALSTALNSRKLRAKQLRDRELLARATEFHMRVERWLGVLLIEAKKAGHICDGRPTAGRVTLREIGIDWKLSSKAQYAAALGDDAFEATVAEMRTRMASGKAKLVNAVPDAEKVSRRRRPTRENSSYAFILECGTLLGNLKVGTVRSRIERMGLELRILEVIQQRVGSASENAMLSIEESISEASLDQIIEAALGKSAAA